MGRHRDRMTRDQALAIIAYDISDKLDQGEGYDGWLPTDVIHQDLLIERLPAFLASLGITTFTEQPATPEPATPAPAEKWEWVPHTCNPKKPGMPLPFGRKAPEGECESCDQLRAGRPPREAPPAVQAAQTRRAHEEMEDRRYREHDCAKAGCFRYPGGTYVCTAFQW